MSGDDFEFDEGGFKLLVFEFEKFDNVIMMFYCVVWSGGVEWWKWEVIVDNLNWYCVGLFFNYVVVVVF